MTLRREKRLREAGLLEVVRPWLSPEPVLIATGEGLAVCGRGELAVAKVSPSTLHHFSVVAHLAADLESTGQRLLSERELLAHERALGERHFSIRLPGGSRHRPDLIAIGEPPTPIETCARASSACRWGWRRCRRSNTRRGPTWRSPSSS